MSDTQESSDHNETLDETVEETDPAENKDRSKRHQCKQCEKTFCHIAGMYNHMRRKHGVVVYSKASIVCKEPDCTFRCSMRDKLQAHLVLDHQKPLAFSTLKFSSIKEFEEWREVFEKQEKCRFVKKSGTRLRTNTGEKHTYLYCSRSGKFVSNSKGKRTKMKKGTSKISNYCTASIDCIEHPSGSVIAKLCSTHYGHEPSVEFLRLTKSDKTVIADKLAQGIPRDVVIDNVRASVGEHLDRVHFLTMKDIRNIERSYGIKSDTKPKTGIEGFASVEDWVNDMDHLGEESPVMFYKRKNAPKVLSDDCNCLEISDFCMVLMTKGQQEILKKFGQNGVFYLTWLSINNGYNLSLLTLMVADDLNEAFPVAYMICTRTTKEIEELFFKVMRDKLGSFCARAIMTDDRKSLYDSWCSVMGFVPYHLLSNRFVDADWRDRLITVQNEDVQCAVYEVLYSYLSCTDSSKFEENLQAFIKHLKENQDTLIFGMYFEDNYLHRVRLWAGCYDKKSVGVNEHLNLDIIYNELVSVCNLKGKFSRLLDKTLQGLLTIVRDRQHNRILKITKQVQDLSHHHSISKNINVDGIQAVENRKWQIKSESSNLLFTVTRKTYECSLKCALVCTDCKMCAHMFECTCRVYNFDRTMCKHIHAIGRLFQRSLTVLDFWDSGSASNKSGANDSLTIDIVKKDISVIKQLSANAADGDSAGNKEGEAKADQKSGPIILDMTTENKFSRNNTLNPLSNKVRKILQSLADNVCEVNNPKLLRKLLTKLKKVKIFMETGAVAKSKPAAGIAKRGRGRPRKNPLNQDDEKPAKRKIGRPRKINSEPQLEIRPRNLQEIEEDQILEERMLLEDTDEEEMMEKLASNNIKSGSEKREDVEDNNDKEDGDVEDVAVQPAITPKRRGRKPKPKPDSETPNDTPCESKKMKIEVVDELDDSTRRKSKRNIKRKQSGAYEYFYDDDIEFKSTSKSSSSSETKGRRGRPPKDRSKMDEKPIVEEVKVDVEKETESHEKVDKNETVENNPRQEPTEEQPGETIDEQPAGEITVSKKSQETEPDRADKEKAKEKEDSAQENTK